MPKIGDYPALTTPDDNDQLVIEDNIAGSTKNITREDFFKGSPLPADTVDTQSMQDEIVENVKLATGAGEPGGVWDSWTPTFTNLSGGTLTYAKYKQVGKTVSFRIKYILGGAGVSGGVDFTLPVAESSDYSTAIADLQPFGNAIFRDAGTSATAGYVVWSASGKAGIRVWNASTTYLSGSALSSTLPFTWASTDEINVAGTYEAA